MRKQLPIDKQMASDRRAAYLLLALLILVFWVSLYLLFGFRLALMIGMVTVPAVGYALSRMLVFHVAPEVAYWSRWFRWRKENGRYHAFDDRPVRVEWNGVQCQVAVVDAFAIIGDTFDKTVCRQLRLRFDEHAFFEKEGVWWFGEQAALDWLATRSKRLDERANRFRNWLLRETFPPLRRKAELAGGQSPDSAQ